MKRQVILIIYILFAFSISLYSVKTADYNWDVLPYAGSVLSLEGNDVNQIHRQTYELFKQCANERVFLQQTTGNKYRETLAENADSFYKTLPFYKIKLLYVALMFVLYYCGVNLFLSAVVISGICYFLISLLIYLWMRRVVENGFIAFTFSAFLSLAPFMLNSASMGTPDMLTGLLVFAAVYVLLTKKNYIVFLMFMLLSVIARPDNIFLLAIVIGVLSVDKESKRYRKLMYLGILLAVLSVILINLWSGNYGYSTLFYHSFVERLTNPAEFNLTITPQMYLKGFMKWIFMVKHSLVSIQILIMLAVLYIKFHSVHEIKNDLESMVLIGMGVSIVLHFAIFPLMDDRFFIAQYLVIDVIFIKTVYDQIVNLKRMELQSSFN